MFSQCRRWKWIGLAACLLTFFGGLGEVYVCFGASEHVTRDPQASCHGSGEEAPSGEREVVPAEGHGPCVDVLVASLQLCRPGSASPRLEQPQLSAAGLLSPSPVLAPGRQSGSAFPISAAPPDPTRSSLRSVVLRI